MTSFRLLRFDIERPKLGREAATGTLLNERQLSGEDGDHPNDRCEGALQPVRNRAGSDPSPLSHANVLFGYSVAGAAPVAGKPKKYV